MKGIAFLQRWCKDKGKKGEATNIPLTHLKGKEGYLWKWRLPVGEADQLLLVRNVSLDSEGCLCKASRTLAAALITWALEAMKLYRSGAFFTCASLFSLSFSFASQVPE